ncbi:MAG: efflux RND transporter periplasmic adaptor subunit [Bacteroidales bacterium]|nr:efflux RND transporter periplasmic adaptor subunit [Bacteroidales bacterium]
MKKNKLILLIVIIGALGISYFIFQPTEDSNYISVKVEQGEFLINISASGDLFAQNSTRIMGPQGLRSVGITEELKLNTIIDEGTLVDSGDFIAKIDPTPVLNKLKEIDANLEKFTASINRSKLDSALTLRSARDELSNQRYAIEELELEYDNSKYETPVTIKKLEISITKAKRKYEQMVNNYKLKKQKEENIVRTAVIDYSKVRVKKDRLNDVLKKFTILAPQAGMLIYEKSWRGKIKTGSTISWWNPVVAKLPDLSKMNIKTYINELDISVVKVGQEVIITVDAFPNKELKGIITHVANIGEELKASSAHVFEVIVEVIGEDDDLRPAMTTKNKILIERIDSVIFIPIECVNTIDSTTFVYSGNKRIEVQAGKSNQDYIIIESGLEKGQNVYMEIPEGANEWSLKKL